MYSCIRIPQRLSMALAIASQTPKYVGRFPGLKYMGHAPLLKNRGDSQLPKYVRQSPEPKYGVLSQSHKYVGALRFAYVREPDFQRLSTAGSRSPKYGARSPLPKYMGQSLTSKGGGNLTRMGPWVNMWVPGLSHGWWRCMDV